MVTAKVINPVFTLDVLGAFCRDGKILLVRTECPGIEWQFPGGYVERGESLRAALMREFTEEFAVEPVILCVVGTCVREFISDISLVFGVEIPADRILIDRREIQEAEFLLLEEFPAQASVRTKRIAEDVLFKSRPHVVVFPSSTDPGIELDSAPFVDLGH